MTNPLEIALQTSASLPDFLQKVIAIRRGKNRAYSLRSLAQRMKVSPSMLSRVSRGQRNFSSRQVRQLSNTLRMNSADSGRLLLLAGAGEDSTLGRDLSRSAHLRKNRATETAHFEIFEKAYQPALLAYLGIPNPRMHLPELGAKFGLPPNEILRAFERLEAAGYLRKNSNTAEFERVAEPPVFQAEHSPLALRAYYRQTLDRASQALRPETVQRRYFASEMFAFSVQDLPKARAAIDRCMNELVLIAAQSEKPDTVFHAGIQLFEWLNGSADGR